MKFVETTISVTGTKGKTNGNKKIIGITQAFGAMN